ncbi:MAG: hypothetical protein NVSMB65_05540 [Chloroflexota bacterium]
MQHPGMARRLRSAGTLLAIPLAAVLLLLVLHNWSHIINDWLPPGPGRDIMRLPGTQLVAQVVLLLVALGLLAWLVRRVIRSVRATALPYLGLERSQALGTLATVLAYALLIPIMAWAGGIELTGLALPGAFTGVIIGIAAQASLGNLINGLVILFTRPYVEGMAITARSPSLVGGEYSGTVTNIGLFYTTMHVAGREVRMPNSAMAQSTVIVRPADLEVYVPVALAPTTRYDEAVVAIRRALADALPPRTALAIVLERVDAAGYLIGVHASVATPADQETLTMVLTRSIAALIVVAPVPAPPAVEAQPAGADHPVRMAPPAAQQNSG